jgi:DNA-directed RNA polymerase specialized sigma24 family protein
VTTNDDKLFRQRDEDEPLEDLIGDVLDLADQTVARITDAEVDEHLRAVLTQSGYAGTGEPAGPAEPGRSAASGIEMLIRTAYGELILRAYRLLGDRSDAEDAVQNACIKVMCCWPRVSMLTEEQQRAYLLKAVINEAVRILRQQHRKPEFPEDCLAENTCNTPGSDERWRGIPEDLAWEEWIRVLPRILDLLPVLGPDDRRRLWRLSEARLRAKLRDPECSGDEPGPGMRCPHRL